jgi:hypothetical protein
MSHVWVFGSWTINAASWTDSIITRHDREYLYHCSQIRPDNIQRNQWLFQPLCIYVGPGIPIIPMGQSYPLMVNYINTSITSLSWQEVVMFVPREIPSLAPAQTGDFTSFIVPFKSYTGYWITQEE